MWVWEGADSCLVGWVTQHTAQVLRLKRLVLPCVVQTLVWSQQGYFFLALMLLANRGQRLCKSSMGEDAEDSQTDPSGESTSRFRYVPSNEDVSEPQESRVDENRERVPLHEPRKPDNRLALNPHPRRVQACNGQKTHDVLMRIASCHVWGECVAVGLLRRHAKKCEQRRNNLSQSLSRSGDCQIEVNVSWQRCGVVVVQVKGQGLSKHAKDSGDMYHLARRCNICEPLSDWMARFGHINTNMTPKGHSAFSRAAEINMDYANNITASNIHLLVDGRVHQLHRCITAYYRPQEIPFLPRSLHCLRLTHF